MNTEKKERRAKPRYPAVRYTAWVRRDSLLGKYRSVRAAAVINFNRTGMSFVSEQRFKRSHNLVLQICSGSERISGIRARVTYVRRQGYEYYVGVEFLQNKPSSKSSRNAGMDVLRSIENLVRSQST